MSWPEEVPYEARRHPDGARERARRGIASARAAIGPRPVAEKPARSLGQTLAELAVVDPAAHQRITAVAEAVLAGEPITCPHDGCGQVLVNSEALRTHRCLTTYAPEAS